MNDDKLLEFDRDGKGAKEVPTAADHPEEAKLEEERMEAYYAEVEDG